MICDVVTLIDSCMKFHDIIFLVDILTIGQLENLLMLKNSKSGPSIEGCFQLYIKLIGELIY
jgi:hypothetical protein